MENIGIEVYEPFKRTENINTSQSFWHWNVANSNFNDIHKADAVFAIVNGNNIIIHQ